MIISLRCFIPTTVSKFYADDAPQTAAAMQLLQKSVAGMMGTKGANVRKLMVDEQIDDQRKKMASNVYNEETDGEDDERNLPIFTPYIWKRSCTALMMFSNALLMTMIKERVNAFLFLDTCLKECDTFVWCRVFLGAVGIGFHWGHVRSRILCCCGVVFHLYFTCICLVVVSYSTGRNEKNVLS